MSWLSNEQKKIFNRVFDDTAILPKNRKNSLKLRNLSFFSTDTKSIKQMVPYIIKLSNGETLTSNQYYNALKNSGLIEQNNEINNFGQLFLKYLHQNEDEALNAISSPRDTRNLDDKYIMPLELIVLLAVFTKWKRDGDLKLASFETIENLNYFRINITDSLSEYEQRNFDIKNVLKYDTDDFFLMIQGINFQGYEIKRLIHLREQIDTFKMLYNQAYDTCPADDSTILPDEKNFYDQIKYFKEKYQKDIRYRVKMTFYLSLVLEDIIFPSLLSDKVFSSEDEKQKFIDDNRLQPVIDEYLKIYNDAKTRDTKLISNSLIFKTGIKSDFHHNRIIFGAPGTGKSYDINKDKDALVKDGGVYERVTFHPDYSYANFVGTYKPTMLDTDIDAPLSEEDKEVFTVLSDKSKTAQEKYDLLYERFRDSGDGLTRLPVLLGVYTDETFKTLKQDGTPASGDNGVERNHGRTIRRFVNLFTKTKSKSEIAYEYVPGPFMRTYVNALKNAQTNNPRPYLLIVEEINRANVAAVFGDVFQLLDRDGDNVSEYGIQASEDIKKYLAKELGGKPQDYSEIKIPDNMFIWATMNSADQGVFPMDTAFKRRWNFDYLGINHNENDIKGNLVAMGSGGNRQVIEWNELRKAINNTLSSYKINEDKLLGPYFLSRKIIVPSEGNEINANIFNSAFKSKVLMYLFDDAAKQKRASLFDGCMDTTKYSSICEEFDERGVEIFCKEIRDKFPKKISMVAESLEEYK